MSSLDAAFDQVVELDTDGNIIRRWAMQQTATGDEWRACDVSEAPGAEEVARCRAIVPGTDVLITQIPLPARRPGERREKAAAYALEDRLAADIEGLHFVVLGAGDKGSETEVAVVAKEDLHRWQQALTSANLEAVSLVPDTALIQRPASGALLHLGLDRCWLVEAAGDALAFEPDLLDEVLSTHDGTTLRITYEKDLDPEGVNQVVEKARQRGIDVTGPSTDSLWNRLGQRHGIELLSGRYAPEFAWAEHIQRFRVPLLLAALVAGLHVVTLTLEARALKDEVRRLEEAVETRFEQLMPDTRMVAPRRQIESQLRNLGQSGGGAAGSSPISLLNHLGEALAGQPSMDILNIEYRPGQLDAELRTQSLQSFSALTASLPTESLQVDLRQASTGSDGTIGQIRLQERTP